MKTQDGSTVETLIDEIVEVCGNISAAEYRLVELIRRMDEYRARAQFGMQGCAHRLNWRCGIDPVTAREVGALLLQALDRGVEWLFRGQPRRPRVLHDDARIADVPLTQRRADALSPEQDDGLNSADRFQVVVHT